MKKFLLLFATVFISFSSIAQSYREWISKAEAAYQSKDYKTSNAYYQKAFVIETKSPADLYNGACSAALAGDTKKAFKFLNLSIDKGWTNINHLKQDSDLNSLHADKQWDKSVAALQKKVDMLEANYDKPLQKELLEIYEADQDIRRAFTEAEKKYGFKGPVMDSLGKLMAYNDSVDLIKVTRILDEHGWVGPDKVGSQANQTLFLVIQHADLKTQLKYLPVMREAVKKGNARGNALALLEDRALIRQGKKQIYGSQIAMNQETHEYYVSPLDDPDRVDERRASVGLGPIADYVKNWNIVWDVKKYKEQLPALEKMQRTY